MTVGQPWYRLKWDRAVDAGNSGRRPLLLPFPACSAQAFGLSDATSVGRGFLWHRQALLGFGLVDCFRIRKGECFPGRVGLAHPDRPPGHLRGTVFTSLLGPRLQLHPWVSLCLNDPRFASLTRGFEIPPPFCVRQWVFVFAFCFLGLPMCFLSKCLDFLWVDPSLGLFWFLYS